MTRAFMILAILVVVGYGVFEARKLIEGPVITITAPRNGSATSTTGVLIEGTAQNIAFLTINDAPAYTDTAGRFVELLSPPPGVTVLTVAGVDRFGRRASKSVTINVLDYCPVANT